MTRGRPGPSKRWKALRAAVLERDGYACTVRGPRCIGTATVAGHVVAWIDGGPDELDNLRAECAPCSSRGGAALGTRNRRRTAALKGRREGWL